MDNKSNTNYWANIENTDNIETIEKTDYTAKKENTEIRDKRILVRASLYQ